MDDKSTQEDEIACLKSIYEENELLNVNKENNRGSFRIKIISPSSSSFNVFFENQPKLILEHLPPLILNFELPSNYPSTSAPQFTLQSRWLNSTELSKLCSKLDELWTQNVNQPILFTWIMFLIDEIFSFLQLDPNELKLVDEDENNNKKPSCGDKRGIKVACSFRLLVDYDKDECLMKFEKARFECQVCFIEYLGADCIQFNKCGHTFCKECMKTYFEVQIKSGNVKSLTCPHDKCESQALPNQVLDLVGFDLFNRYDLLLLKDSLNSMSDIIYCPRAQCQCPVIPEETLARCPDCKFTFCALCRQTYHGIETCKITQREIKEIFEKYKQGDETVRNELIKRHGEACIRKIIEESMSMELIVHTSKQCPNCQAWMQKLEGCNKMTCAKCRCFFCWLCLVPLSKADPYAHFNNMRSECYSRLFEGIQNEDNVEEVDEVAEQDEEVDNDGNLEIVFLNDDDLINEIALQLF